MYVKNIQLYRILAETWHLELYNLKKGLNKWKQIFNEEKIKLTFSSTFQRHLEPDSMLPTSMRERFQNDVIWYPRSCQVELQQVELDARKLLFALLQREGSHLFRIWGLKSILHQVQASVKESHLIHKYGRTAKNLEEYPGKVFNSLEFFTPENRKFVVFLFKLFLCIFFLPENH